MLEMLHTLRFKSVKRSIFFAVVFLLIILIIVFSIGVVSNSNVLCHPSALQTLQAPQQLKMTSEDHQNNSYLLPLLDVRVVHKLKLTEVEILDSSNSVEVFDSRVRDFFHKNQCRIQIFMTWISPVDSFKDREFAGLQSLFHTNPNACLIILSKTMDSEEGQKILDPLINKGFTLQAMTPDLHYLLKNTPAEDWINRIRSGDRDPGEVPLAQNLSNLIRLAVVYKYGGIYLDTDFIVLKDISGIRNSIGAQSVDTNGNWTRLNNAVLIFNKNHSLVYKFIEEFAMNYNGNVWGHNGPYLVSRVVSKVMETRGINDFMILPPMTFYPVDWIRVAGFFTQPSNRASAKWVDAKVQQLRRESFGMHLWNSRTKRLEIEEGSIVGRLISDHCVV